MPEEERRKISPEELEKILEQHRLWLQSEQQEGARADLNDANLFYADLSRADLGQRSF